MGFKTTILILALALAQEIDINTLTSIDYEEGKPLPAEIQALDEQEVALSGYMHLFPGKSDTFYLVPDPCACASRPKVHEFVAVTLDGEEVDWTASRVRVKGTLQVGEVKEDGFVTSIYRLEGNLD